jgi:hypothetical protein
MLEPERSVKLANHAGSSKLVDASELACGCLWCLEVAVDVAKLFRRLLLLLLMRELVLSPRLRANEEALVVLIVQIR